MEEGKMQASYFEENGDQIVHNFSTTEFCLEHKQVYDNQTTPSHVDQTFLICTKEEPPCEGEAFTHTFYPAALLISSVFLFFTIISYCLDPDLHGPLFGKIT